MYKVDVMLIHGTQNTHNTRKFLYKTGKKQGNTTATNISPKEELYL